MALEGIWCSARRRLFFVTLVLVAAMSSLPGATAMKQQFRAFEVQRQAQHTPNRTYAYYIQVYKEPLMAANLLRMLRKIDPDALVFMLSDGGYDFSELAKKYKVHFTLAGVNIGMKHGERFLFRLGKAMAKCDCEFLVMLEEDTCMLRQPTRKPKGDIGGLAWTDMRGFGPFVELLKKYKQPVKPPKWGFVTGAAGGSYYRVATMMQLPEVRNGTLSSAFHDLMTIMPRFKEENLLSNDMAGPALAYVAGLRVHPWRELREQDKSFNGIGPSPATGKEAFEHQCSEQMQLAGMRATYDKTLTPPAVPTNLASLPPDGEF